ncbi:uncharacterized protein MONOS_12743 [Monocercomonoides exilis]|uniref:uncharacterized protein n=1 Tax=Monocercomonoides exilis TaxID=2049356 RepID=UPI00355A0098|nr:hypothetical protein MONOS_12743 [Monocercomonoides exilis]|eukprot:MONOS_12743.1-p1 / transcript=MONOS_12743.1 / gene=MONOS_12743 / organism=Monocercomonoides_exilis_PA203 / gene_product=unspecified product / transcript_product=unspecified product / location=Mono_scaffold00727:21550-22371(-) / protein_length=151 / sequence_SO=supercontig / SO=protein_coding / is_pseudo=false
MRDICLGVPGRKWAGIRVTAFAAALTHVCVHPVCVEKVIEIRGGRASVSIRSMTQPQCSQRSVEVLIQVPKRSIELQRGIETRTRSVVPGAYGMQTVSYEVYFPESWEFMHYPALVAMRGRHVCCSRDGMHRVRVEVEGVAGDKEKASLS